MILRSVEMIAYLYVLSIMHICLCIPLRWLVGNCGDLSKHNFGVADMPITLDLMDKTFSEIVHDGDKILNEDFMCNIFKPLQDKIPPFKDYMTFMFEERTSRALVSTSNEEKVKPWKMLKTALFAATRIDIVQTAGC